MLLPSGETAYTRAGNFSVNAQGQLVTADGYLVQPTMISPDRHEHHHLRRPARCRSTSRGATTPTQVGQLQLASFFNAAGLEPRATICSWRPTPRARPRVGTPGQHGYGTIMQGYTEASNVDPVSEITNLIVAQRAYEMNSKVITTADQMLQTNTR